MATKAQQLARLPVGLSVAVAPPIVYARPGPHTSRWAYRWFFQVTVQATSRPLHIERFGLTALTGRWACTIGPTLALLTGGKRPKYAEFLPHEFCREFGFYAGRLEPGVLYTYAHGWVGGARLKEGRLRLFFLAHDDEGQQCKGEGKIELRDWMLTGPDA